MIYGKFLSSAQIGEEENLLPSMEGEFKNKNTFAAFMVGGSIAGIASMLFYVSLYKLGVYLAHQIAQQFFQ